MSDTTTGVRSALKLGLSLSLSWSVALAVRILLPRALGPETFGIFTFAEAFATSWFVIVYLGVDTYIRKEVPLRPAHASDFFGGAAALRLVGSGVLWLVMMGILVATQRSALVLQLVTIFALVQLVIAHNNSLSALLQSVQRIDAVAVWSVLVKVLWGGLVALGLVLGYGAVGAALGLLASEVARTVALQRACRIHLDLRWRVDRAATGRLLVDSLPYFVAAIASTLAGKLDVALLGALSTNQEVGWYAAAQSIAGLSLMLTPIIGWVLLPLSSHAAARSTAELGQLMRRALEIVLQLAIPIVLCLALFGDVIAVGLFGQDFAPTARSIRILSPTFVLTYVASVSASFLVRLDKGWWVTRANLWGLAANVLLNVVLIPVLGPALGNGGAGVAAGLAAMASEALVAVLLFASLRGENFDARSVRNLARTAVAVALVVGLHVPLAMLDVAWPVRITVEALVYLALVFGLGAVHVADVRDLLVHVQDEDPAT